MSVIPRPVSSINRDVHSIWPWTSDGVETMKGCISSINLSIFHNLELNRATQAVSDYINFLVYNTVAIKDHLYHPKPYIT